MKKSNKATMKPAPPMPTMKTSPAPKRKTKHSGVSSVAKHGNYPVE